MKLQVAVLAFIMALSSTLLGSTPWTPPADPAVALDAAAKEVKKEYSSFSREDCGEKVSYTISQANKSSASTTTIVEFQETKPRKIATVKGIKTGYFHTYQVTYVNSRLEPDPFVHTFDHPLEMH